MKNILLTLIVFGIVGCASVPKEPTAFRATILTKANKMLFKIDGQARPQTDKVSGLDGESTSSSFSLLSKEFKFYPSIHLER